MDGSDQKPDTRTPGQRLWDSIDTTPLDWFTDKIAEQVGKPLPCLGWHEIPQSARDIWEREALKQP
jgi:hypothetical protein